MTDFEEYVCDVLADILWARDDLCEWFKYEGVSDGEDSGTEVSGYGTKG